MKMWIEAKNTKFCIVIQHFGKQYIADQSFGFNMFYTGNGKKRETNKPILEVLMFFTTQSYQCL